MAVNQNLANIDTIVIAMMENRSFDHLLGFLSHEWYDGRKDVDGLHLHSPDFDWDNPDSQGRAYAPTATPDSYLPSDLPHSRVEVAVQLNGGAMDGFIKSYFAFQRLDESPAPMRFCRPEDIPITAALARRHCVCDRWFAPLPDDTMPNRLMALSGYSLIDSTDKIKPPFHLLPDQTTIFDWLKQRKKNFEIYVDAKAIEDVGPPTNLLLMKSQWEHLVHAHTLDTLKDRWLGNAPAPAVMYVEPFYNDFATAVGFHGNCNHPPLPVAYGEDFLKRLYQALTSNPEKWAKTMLVICYDEHGGFFDHVSPPPLHYPPPKNHTWSNPKAFETLGVRIPGIIVSPWVKPGTCFRGQLDHTSILQLMVDRFGAPEDLSYFGDAINRKSKIVSLADTLNGEGPEAALVRLDDAPPVVGTARTPPISDAASMFRGVIADKPLKRLPMSSPQEEP
jgi:phospholipase C